jgi:hypothetical protein
MVEFVDECVEEGFDKIGEALYLEHFYWSNSEDLIDSDSQIMIKQYLYCSESNTPPYPSFNETPADFIDAWMIIKEEINHIRKAENERK